MRIGLAALLVCACGSAAGPAPLAVPAAAPTSARATVRPHAYRLNLDLDPERQGFHGSVAIDAEIDGPTQRIELSSVELDIVSARVVQGQRDQLAKVKPWPKREVIELRLTEALTAGPVQLELEFRGRHGDRIGLFRQRVGGHSYIFSDFQPVDARRAFPCFDQPKFRTPFTVSVTAPRKYVVAGNAVVASTQELDDSRVATTFEPTPPLPTYLVAVAVGPFEVVEGPKTPVPLRVLALRGRAAEAKAALRWMPRYLSYMARYTGIPVPVDKLDLVAVPHMDGAMENHALFLFDDDLLLLPAGATDRHRQMVHMVLAHEASHAWFGNLVGFARWEDLWLSEGFATLMADEIGTALHPEERIETRQIIYRRDAMRVDRDPWARAIGKIGDGPRAPERSFDPLSYKKAGAVLSMLEAALGKERFRRAVRRYLRQGRGRAVTPSELSRALDTVDSRAGAAISSFTTQSSFPILTVRGECDGASARVDIEQHSDPWLTLAEPASPASRASWVLPVCVAYGDSSAAKDRKKSCGWMTRRKLSLPVSSCPAWVFANADGAAYARVAVDASTLASLAKAPLNARERATLIDSLGAAVDVRQIDAREAAQYIARLAQSDDHHELGLALQVLEGLVQPGAAFEPELAQALESFARRARRLLRGPEESRSLADRIHRRALLLFAALRLSDAGVLRGLRSIAERALSSRAERGDRDVTTAALEVFATELSADEVAAFVAATASAPASQIPDRIGVLASVVSPKVAEGALRAVAAEPRLSSFLPVLVGSYASTTPLAAMALAYVDQHRSLLRGRIATELRDLFGDGLCDARRLPDLDRLLPPTSSDTAAVKIRRCDAHRRLAGR